MAVSANDPALLSPAAGTSAALVGSPVMKKVTLNVPSEGRSTAAIAAGAARIVPATRAPNILNIVVLPAPQRLATTACPMDRRYIAPTAGSRKPRAALLDNETWQQGRRSV